MDNHDKYMEAAIKEANKSLAVGEIPVGAVIVLNDKIIARGFNQKELKQNATRHAELIAIEKACKKLGSWRLDECTLYVTLEPCIMCTGVIIQSHLKRVVFSLSAVKQTALDDILTSFPKPHFNHYPEIIRGVREEEVKILIKDFFKSIRNNRKKDINVKT